MEHRLIDFLFLVRRIIHNCETGDILTPEPGNWRPCCLDVYLARIDDLLLIEDTGAYCQPIRAKRCNAFPGAQQVFTQYSIV